MTTEKMTSATGKWKQYSTIIALILLIIFFIYKYCKQPDNKAQFELNEPIQAPVALAFIDANRYLNTNIPTAKITLIDPDSMVVTSNGLPFKEITVDGGIMSLGLKLKATYSREKPYRFIIKVEAPGYSTNYRSILITENKPHYVPVFLAKTDDLPEGMAGFQGALAVNNSTSLADLVLKPLYPGNVGASVRVEIPKGTLFFHDDCLIDKAVDSIDYRFSYGTPASIAAGRTFPGGPLVTDAVDRNGQPIATPASPFYFASAGWMNMEMNVGGNEVNRFSQPITLKIPISNALSNPNTQQPYQVGDKVDTWSLGANGVWQQDSIVTVKEDAAGKYAELKVNHLSTWNLDFKTDACSTPLNINYTYSGVMSPIPYYCELIRAQGGVAFGITGASTATNTLEFTNPSGSHQIINAPANTDVEFIVHDNPTAPGTTPLVSSGVFTTCASPGSITIPTAQTPQSVNMTFEVMVQGDTHPVCNNTLWFKECSSCGTQASCSAAGTAYHYGGNITVTGTVGAITLRRNGNSFSDALHSNHCIKLYYAGLNGGTTVSTPIEFTMDFADTTNRDITGASAGGAVTIRYTYVAGTSTHRFVILSGVTALTRCLD